MLKNTNLDKYIICVHDIKLEITRPEYDYKIHLMTRLQLGGARGVMVIVVGNGHGDTSSNPRRG